MGLWEERERAARQRVEALQAEPREAEALLERRVVALADPVPPPVKEPVAGSVVPHWREGVTAGVLAPEYGGC